MDETTYWQLHGLGGEAVEEARLSDAARLFAAAEAEARRLGKPALADRAFCNQAAVRYREGSATGIREGLSRILGSSPDARARELAAYNLAVLFRRRQRLGVARFYGETALRQACSLGEGSIQAVCLDFLGRLRIQEGRTSEGVALFEQSLEVAQVEVSVRRALTLGNLAYCSSVAGRRSEALRLLEEGLKVFARSPSLLYEPGIRLNAGFTLLEAGEPEAALANGRHALNQCAVESFGGEGKYALYLVGEALVQQGDRSEAKEHFVQLQRRYYPQIPDLPDLLLTCRTHVFLNWLA